jgi:hypothetical protein
MRHHHGRRVLLLAIAVLLVALPLAAFAASAASPAKKNAKPQAKAASTPEQAAAKGEQPRAPRPLHNAPAISVESRGKDASERSPRKARRRMHAGKHRRPAATLQVKPDLSYHGMLTQPQRYEPTPSRRSGRAPNPQAGDLLHDHFQELDKNHDGLIDPLERALGRLDIDRDLTNRRWD